MPPYLTHYQFAFTDHQRNQLRKLAGLVRAGLEENRRRGVEYAAEGEPERIPLAPLDQLLAELAKFTYNLDEPSIPKVSLSARLLILFLFELMQKIGGNLTATHRDAPAHDADDYLRLHYFLSYDFTYYHTMHDYHGITNGSEREYVNTAGMSELAVFTALYNAAKPKGLGFLQDDARNISEEEGALRYYARKRQLPDWDTETNSSEEPTNQDEPVVESAPLVSRFDYVDGRAMKVSRDEIEQGLIDVTTFNQYNGEGAAQHAVEALPRA